MSKAYMPSKAEKMFLDLGYYKYTSEYLDCIIYKKRSHEISFSLGVKRFYAQINESDINFGKYRPMEIDMETLKCINEQLKELGWIE